MTILVHYIQVYLFRYILIIINDVLIITGCALKESIEGRRTLEDLWDACALCLGTGNLLVWIGMLRYLGFFKVHIFYILFLEPSMTLNSCSKLWTVRKNFFTIAFPFCLLLRHTTC